MSMFDVIVVGAGPAGSTAAYRLGKGGAKVLLLDKAKQFPREKPCAGGITSRVLTRFPYIKDVFAGIDVNPVSRVLLESPKGLAFTHESDAPMIYLVRRWEFDAALFRLAEPLVTVELGATVRNVHIDAEGVTVELIDGRSFHASMILGADSVNSVVARQVGLRTGEVREELAIDIMEETPSQQLQTTRSDTVSLLLKEAGYGYIFPKVQHTNLGICCLSALYLEEMRGRARERHTEWVEEVKERGMVSGEAEAAYFRAFPIPIGGPRKTHAERVLLAGDAGCFVNGFSAEGIYFAMTSGELAADAALEAIAKNDFSAKQLRSYERAWKGEVGEELERSVQIKKRIYNDLDRMEVLVKAAVRDPQLAKLFMEYSMGAASYDEMRSHALRSSLPKWILSKVKTVFGFKG